MNKFLDNRMTIYEYGNPTADVVLIQLVGDHDLHDIENEITEIRNLINKDFRFIVVKVNNWYQELTPWKAPAVLGNESFGDGAWQTLEKLLKICTDKNKTYYIGGYSLSGLFALWASCQTDIFYGVAAASPSVWFPGFVEYLKERKIKSRSVYLSLGNKEEKTKNSVMSKVGDCIRELYAWMQAEEIQCTLEWNQGGHFKDPTLRVAKAFAWVLNTENEKGRNG